MELLNLILKSNMFRISHKATGVKHNSEEELEEAPNKHLGLSQQWKGSTMENSMIMSTKASDS